MPKVFVSSTIYDFADLRSALKFHLENAGFEVMLSELNDFDKDGNENSYDACLKAIEECDYFILLVGSRIGGWADKATSTTITMAEYRKARERFDAGKIRMVSFVRRDLWTIKEDRAELQRYLRKDLAKSREVADGEVETLVKHPSKFANDATVLFAFIDEVARLAEMHKAIEGKGQFPKGNWVHSFVTFGEVFDALRVELQLPRSDLRRVGISTLVISEIKENVRLLLQPFGGGKIEPMTTWSAWARKAFGGAPEDSSRYAANYIKWLVMFSFPAASAAKNLKSTFLKEALLSGVFLEWSSPVGSFQQTELQRAMMLLAAAIAGAEADGERFKMREVVALNERAKAVGDEGFLNIDNLEIVSLITLHDELQNVLLLSKRIIAALDAESLAVDVTGLAPRSPFRMEQEQIEKEAATTSDVDLWLKR